MLTKIRTALRVLMGQAVIHRVSLAVEEGELALDTLGTKELFIVNSEITVDQPIALGQGRC